VIFHALGEGGLGITHDRELAIGDLAQRDRALRDFQAPPKAGVRSDHPVELVLASDDHVAEAAHAFRPPQMTAPVGTVISYNDIYSSGPAMGSS
jgi:hypothetical protein